MLIRDEDATAKRLGSLKKLGDRIAIDDFGSGYSSPAYLSHFPVDALQIDLSLVSGPASLKESGALLHTLVQLGKALNIETLAEGIEEPLNSRPFSARTATTDKDSCSHARYPPQPSRSSSPQTAHPTHEYLR